MQKRVHTTEMNNQPLSNLLKLAKHYGLVSTKSGLYINYIQSNASFITRRNYKDHSINIFNREHKSYPSQIGKNAWAFLQNLIEWQHSLRKAKSISTFSKRARDGMSFSIMVPGVELMLISNHLKQGKEYIQKDKHF